MIQLIIAALLFIVVGVFIYLTKFKDKEKPKIEIKGENLSDYLKVYENLKLYWMSISFILLGVLVLIALLIIEIVFG